jgi:hypothetical protein
MFEFWGKNYGRIIELPSKNHNSAPQHFGAKIKHQT